MRSKPIEQILAEARELAADGAVELNLIGQDTTSYGTDIGYAPGLSGLLPTLDRELKDVHWLRLMYAYPSCFTDEMIRTIADRARVVKYIDMPLQHINDEAADEDAPPGDAQADRNAAARSCATGSPASPSARLSSPARPARPTRSTRSW